MNSKNLTNMKMRKGKLYRKLHISESMKEYLLSKQLREFEGW